CQCSFKLFAFVFFVLSSCVNHHWRPRSPILTPTLDAYPQVPGAVTRSLFNDCLTLVPPWSGCQMVDALTLGNSSPVNSLDSLLCLRLLTESPLCDREMAHVIQVPRN
ncbi:hypothetical protein EDB84DRAFT_1460090, partial [Lactarius hengduanensis]